MRLSAFGLAGLLLAASVSTGSAAPEAAPQRSVIIMPQDSVKSEQPPPHNGTGMSTAYRYSDQAPGRTMEFRVRALHPGASIGEHVLTHDEVYYVLSGEGDLIADGKVTRVGKGTAVYIYTGNNVGIRQVGKQDLVLAIAYPVQTKGAGK